ncbi:MAG: Tn3 family transposase [Nevskiaceae bacterium]|nr:MAG: Tn3 family transposase [Nevskiaceae bacterium]
MTPVHRNAFPLFLSNYTPQQLEADFKVTDEEGQWIRKTSTKPQTRFLRCLLLKCFQRLYRFPKLQEIPEEVVEYLRKQIRVGDRIEPDFKDNETLTLNKNAVRQWLGDVKSCLGPDADKRLKDLALQAAEAVDGRDDVINSMVEGFLQEGIELPPYSRVYAVAERAHSEVQGRVIREIAGRIPSNLRLTLLSLLKTGNAGSLSQFNSLKLAGKGISRNQLNVLADHMQWLETFGDIDAIVEGINESKIRFFGGIAKHLDAGSMKDFNEPKRLACMVSLIHTMRVRTRDQLADMLTRRMGVIHGKASKELDEIKIRQSAKMQYIAVTLRGVVEIVHKESNDTVMGKAVRTYVGSDEESKALVRVCEEVESRSTTNHLPLIWDHFISSRAALYRIVEQLKFEATSDERSVLDALALIQKNQGLHREWIKEPDLSLAFMTERWRALVCRETGSGPGLHRRFFEVCVFSCLADQLRSGDVAVIGSEQFADHRRNLLSWEECLEILPEYCGKVGLATTKEAFVADLRNRLTAEAAKLDARYPECSGDFVIRGNTPYVRRVEAREIPDSANELEVAIAARMPRRNLIDILANVEQLSGYTRFFGPITKNETKIDDPIPRYLMNIFACGCNLGFSQTADHFPKSKINAEALSFVNRRHFTVENLNSALRLVTETYLNLELPSVWGTAETVSVDGTHYETYDQNLHSGFHFRYRKRGLVAYRHVAGSYIAVFRRFIPPGLHESLFVIDGLLEAGLSVEASKVYGDSHAQTTAVFCFAHTSGINLMPRIKNWKDLTMYRPDEGAKYENIDSLFTRTIDWNVIETHWKDIMQMALSIYRGKISPSMLLRKLNSYSLRNKVYAAAMQIGNVVRTIYLLKWIGDKELRREVTAGTTKSESYNKFGKHFNFGGDALPINDADEQQKRLRYTDLVANIVIVQNTIDMDMVLKKMEAERYPFKREDVGFLSPYVTSHIRRFGDYHLKLNGRSEAWLRDGLYQEAANAALKQINSTGGKQKPWKSAPSKLKRAA